MLPRYHGFSDSGMVVTMMMMMVMMMMVEMMMMDHSPTAATIIIYHYNLISRFTITIMIYHIRFSRVHLTTSHPISFGSHAAYIGLPQVFFEISLHCRRFFSTIF